MVIENQIFSSFMRDKFLNCVYDTSPSFGDVLTAEQNFAVAKLVVSNDRNVFTKSANIYVVYDGYPCLFVPLVKECNHALPFISCWG